MAPSEKLIFETSMDVLFKSAKGQISPAAEDKLRALGLAFDKKLIPAYPAQTWASAVKIIAADLFPREPEVEAHRKLAMKSVAHFAETLVGKALFTVARVLGPDRSLARMTHNFRTGANFIETKLTVISPGTHELWMNDVSGVPGFYQGLIEAASIHTGRQPDAMTIAKFDGTECTFLIERPKP